MKSKSKSKSMIKRKERMGVPQISKTFIAFFVSFQFFVGTLVSNLSEWHTVVVGYIDSNGLSS